MVNEFKSRYEYGSLKEEDFVGKGMCELPNPKKGNDFVPLTLTALKSHGTNMCAQTFKVSPLCRS